MERQSYVLENLAKTLSSNNEERLFGEKILNDLLGSNPSELCDCLIDIVLNDKNENNFNNIDISLRQAALIFLKKIINRNWSIGLESFVGPPLPIKTKNNLKSSLLTLVESSHVKIRNLSSQIVSLIASTDFPDEWPYLLNELNVRLCSKNDNAVLGTLAILEDILETTLLPEHFLPVSFILLSELFSLASDSDRNLSIRVSSISAFTSATGFFLTQDINLATDKFGQIVSKWLEYFLNIFSSISSHISNTLSSIFSPPTKEDLSYLLNALPILYESLNATKKLFTEIPEIIQLLHKRLLFNSYSILKSLAPIFKSVYISTEKFYNQFSLVISENNLSSTFETVSSLSNYSLSSVLQENISLFTTALSSQQLFDALFPSHESLLEAINIAVYASYIPDDLYESWQEDATQFVSEEMELSTSFSLRYSASEFIASLIENSNNLDFFSIVKNLVQKTFSNFALVPYSNSINYRLLEATLCVFELVLVNIDDKDLLRNSLSEQELTSILYIIKYGLQCPDPLLKSRAILVSAKIGDIFKDIISVSLSLDMYDSILNNVSNSSEKNSPIVILSTLLSIKKYAHFIPHNNNIEKLPLIYSAIEQTLPFAQGDIAILLVEVLQQIAKIDPLVINLNQSSIFIPLLFQAAAKDPSNVELVMEVHDVIEQVTQSNSSGERYVILCTLALSPLLDAIESLSSAQYSATSSMIMNFLEVIITNGPSPLPPNFVNRVLPILIAIIMQSDDNEILQNATINVKELISHDPEQVKNFHHQNLSSFEHAALYSSSSSSFPNANNFSEYLQDKNGIQLVLELISRLLSPQLSDSEALMAGSLISTFLQAYADLIQEFMEPLLTETARRLLHSHNPLLTEGLASVFSYLLQKSPHDVINFLAFLNLHSNSNKNGSGFSASITGLEVFIRAIIDSYEIGRSYDQLRKNIELICNLYLMNDQRIYNVLINSEIILDDGLNQNDEHIILTRSRVRQAQLDAKTKIKILRIPAAVKICKLLLIEFKSRINDDKTAEDKFGFSIPSDAMEYLGLNVTTVGDEERAKENNHVGGGKKLKNNGNNDEWEDVDTNDNDKFRNISFMQFVSEAVNDLSNSIKYNDDTIEGLIYHFFINVFNEKIGPLEEVFNNLSIEERSTLYSIISGNISNYTI